jgi:hypothetical protein
MEYTSILKAQIEGKTFLNIRYTEVSTYLHTENNHYCEDGCALE